MTALGLDEAGINDDRDIWQEMRLALKLAHRGYVMETGSITLSGPASDLLNNARVQDAYLGE